ncbi:hypothetical protein AnigIFM50267_004356 [Aspergillus niger]|nr:hypothetical protein AnigIFM50267_004356 [Aspergillus niger]
MADVIWESYRPEVERLYIHENQKLGEVREYLRIKYGLDERWSAQRVSISSYLHGSQATKKILAPSPNIPEWIVVCTPAMPGTETTGTPQSFDDGWYRDDDLAFKPEDPQSVLRIAAQQDDNRLFKFFSNLVYLSSHLLIDGILEQVVDMNQKIKIYYPDTAAVKNQLVPIIQWLVKSPQTNNDYLGDGAGRRTALQHAVNNGNMDLINLLLDHGADVNSAPSEDGGATALQIAAIQGYLGIACKLLT